MTLGRFNHRLFPDGQYFRMASGHRFFVPGDPHFFGYITGHEPYIANLIDQLVRPGDVCFDVGANIGYFTSQLAALCGARGLVASYEPDSENFEWLQKNAALARSAGCNIELVKAAVSEQPGKRRVVRGKYSTLHKTEAADEGDVDVIASVSLNSEWVRLNLSSPIRLIKIDVEGHEPEVLLGMDRIVHDRRLQYAILEISPGGHAASIDKILNGWGRRVKSVSCWIDGVWQGYALSDVAYRSDVLVAFE